MKNLYVGSDKQFKSIQSAIDSIPNVMSDDVTIFVDSGSYKEQIKIKNKTGHAIIIEGIGTELNEGLPGVKQPLVNVQQIQAFDIQGVLRIKNIRFVWSDQIDNSRGVIHLSRVSYGAVNNCFFDGKTKYNSKESIFYDGSNGSVADTLFNNQYICINALNSAVITVRSNLHTLNKSQEYIRSTNAIVFDAYKQQLGPVIKQQSGQVF